MHGGLIVTNSKEQSMQVYEQIRGMEVARGLRIARLGSISFLIPHIVKKDVDGRVRLPSSTEMETISKENCLKVSDWSSLDLLIATPDQIDDILSRGGKKGPKRLNPAWIIFEDYELMFQNRDRIEELRMMLRHFLGTQKSELKEFNEHRKVVKY
jgi:hypothetical protein